MSSMLGFSLLLALAGIVLMLVPAEFLVHIDRQAGYFAYKRTLDSTGDEQQALRAAADFYHDFGMAMLVAGVVGALLSLVLRS